MNNKNNYAMKLYDSCDMCKKSFICTWLIHDETGIVVSLT